MQLQITDNSSGFKGGCVSLDTPAPFPLSGFSMTCFDATNRIAGTSLSGIYQVSVNFPRYSHIGFYPIDNIVISDVAGNSDIYYGYELALNGWASGFHVTGVDDETAPSLASFAMSPTSGDISAGKSVVVTVTLHLTDGLSGIRGGCVSIALPGVSGQVLPYACFSDAKDRVSGTANDGVYQTTMTFSAPQSPGTYTVANVEFHDSAINQKVLSTTDLSQAGYPTTVNITNPDATTPGAPTLVTAAAEDRAALVSWTAPASNGGAAILDYTVSTSPGGQTITVAGTLTSAHVSLLSNRTYTFKVHATNGVGSGPDSQPSAPVTTPPSAPEPPTNVTVTPGTGSATITWGAPYDGGLPITSYTVRSDSGAVIAQVPGDQTAVTVTGLVGGYAYQFAVTATNAFSVGIQSNWTTPTLIAVGVPTSVTNVWVTPGHQSGTVTWNPPTNDGGTPIVSYALVGPNGRMTVPASQTAATYTGLTDGQVYQLTVYATNAVGDAAGIVTSPFEPHPVPATPTNVSAFADGSLVGVTWVEPCCAPVDSYTLTVLPGGRHIITPDTSETVSGLTIGVSYTFTVHATSGGVPSPESAPSNPVTPVAPQPPGTPTNVLATAHDHYASVTWSVPPDNGSVITSYTVSASPGNAKAVVDASHPAADVGGLTNGVAYRFTVHATNDLGDGPESALSNAVTPSGSATTPSAPTSVSAVPGDGQATVSWQTPSSNGGAAIGSYTVTANPGGAHVTASAVATTAVVTSLIDGTAYTFTVRATNGVGNGPDSAPSSPVVPVGPPPPPTHVSASPLSGAAVVSWQAPASDNGSPITGYDITTAPATKATHTASSQTGAIITGLANGTTYTFTVRATNAMGSGTPSSLSNAIKPAGSPKAPTAVHASVSHGVVVVSWAAPSNNGSPTLTYAVSESPGAKKLSVSASHTQVSFTGLSAGVHTFRVHATNSLGTSAWSSASNSVTIVVAQTTSRSGYLMLSANGTVYPFGNAPRLGSSRPAVAIAVRRDGSGYWTVDGAGNVSGFGTASVHGGNPSLRPGEIVSTISASPSGKGYWLFTNRGRAFAYGDAHFYGDMSGQTLNGPIIASAATPTGHGYYMVGSDGGVFNFGDAAFHGSTGGMHLNRPIVGIAPTPDNRGYWLVASDGGVFAFNAPFRGSMGGTHLNKSVNGLVAYGNGYLMVASDGGVFDFSNKTFAGSLANNPPAAPIVGIAAFATS